MSGKNPKSHDAQSLVVHFVSIITYNRVSTGFKTLKEGEKQEKQETFWRKTGDFSKKKTSFLKGKNEFWRSFFYKHQMGHSKILGQFSFEDFISWILNLIYFLNREKRTESDKSSGDHRFFVLIKLWRKFEFEKSVRSHNSVGYITYTVG